MSAKYEWGMAAAAHLVIQGRAEDFQNVWAWAWIHYGENAMYADWADGFYIGLRSAGYALEGAGQAVLESV